MPFSRQTVAEQDRRRALAQQIVDRHMEEECEAVWKQHLGKMPHYVLKYYLTLWKSHPVVVAELLEPGELDRMMAEESK